MTKQRGNSGITHSRHSRPGEAAATSELKLGSRGGSGQTILRHFRRTGAFLMLAVMAFALPVPAGQKSIAQFDVPGAISTQVGGISPAGEITGVYLTKTDGRFQAFGFLRSKDGRFTSFDAPPQVGEPGIWPSGVGINTAGEITGTYGRFVVEFAGHKFYIDTSFLRSADGTVSDISPPDTFNSYAHAINAKGTIVGTYEDPIAGSWRFYLRAADGTYATIDPPALDYAVQIGMNTEGAVTGCYYDADGFLRSFLRTAEGTIITFDAPGTAQGTQAVSISPNGDITGYYYDENFVTHGFLRAKDGQFTTFDPPGSAGTSVVGITSAGAIAGNYYDENFVSHGFLRSKNGQFTIIDPPGSTRTYVRGITPSGTITGDYTGADRKSHGFLY